MRRDIVAARGLGADGVVIGALRPDGTRRRGANAVAGRRGGRSGGHVSSGVRLRAGCRRGAGDAHRGRSDAGSDLGRRADVRARAFRCWRRS